jgi:hypothetical protein
MQFYTPHLYRSPSQQLVQHRLAHQFTSHLRLATVMGSAVNITVNVQKDVATQSLGLVLTGQKAST